MKVIIVIIKKAFCETEGFLPVIQILYMQVCLHSFFFLVSAFFSVFIFLFDAEEESNAANAIAVTPEARMRATMVFFIPFYLVPKSYYSFCAG